MSRITEHVAMACAYPHCYSVVQSAKGLGTFSGTLTALTFSVVVVLTGRSTEEHPAVEKTLVVFLGAFVSMSVATYLFIGAASEEHPGSRIAAETFIASLAFSCALLQLFLGIAQLMHDRGFAHVVGFAAWAARWVVGTLIFLYMSTTAVGAAGVMESESAAWTSLLGIGCGVLFVALLAWIAGGPATKHLATPGDKPRAIETWAAFNIVVVVIAGVFTVIWGERGSNAALPGVAYLGFMGLLFLSIARYSMLLKSLMPE